MAEWETKQLPVPKRVYWIEYNTVKSAEVIDAVYRNPTGIYLKDLLD